MIKNIIASVFAFTFVGLSVFQLGCSEDVTTNGSGSEFFNSSPCNEYGTLPIRTVYPVTIPLICEDGEQLSWQQGSAIRFACVNYPAQADLQNRKWPLVIYLHGSLVTPMSLYTIGRDFFDLRDDFKLSNDQLVKGFIILSPEGRIAKPWTGNGPATGEGFHWDEWYRNPDENLDAQAIDHFLDEVIATGKVDTNRIYVYGWSNGAYMSVLYSTWRSSRIAAMSQYAGANPWMRTPCPIPISYTKQVPLFLLRNLCDALVPCDSSRQWVDTLQARNWPFEYHNLDAVGDITSDENCSTNPGCSGEEGLAEHFRWPRSTPLKLMLEYFKQNPMR